MITDNNRWVFMGILSITLLLNGVHATEKNNSSTLCPASGSEQRTILLIDTTDPLTLVAQEKLKNLLKGFLSPKNKYYLQPAHELIAYRLTPQVGNMGKPIRVCNPGNPKDRTWTDDLTSGVIDARRKWRHFEQQIRRVLPRINEQVEGERSPLLESIALITARHVPSLGAEKQRKPTRLILFSDMLQHSERLSHYESLPKMKTFKALVGYAEMNSDLRSVDVWLFYVRRTGLEHIQTPKHYYWWTQAIELFGGRLMEQVPL